MALTWLTSINVEGAVLYEQNLRMYAFMLALRIHVTNTEWAQGIQCQEPLSGEGTRVVSAFQTAETGSSSWGVGSIFLLVSASPNPWVMRVYKEQQTASTLRSTPH